MIKGDQYFSEIEMMKRHPLLYEQLVGQYLTGEEKRERDKYEMKENVTFVKILMEGIERLRSINRHYWTFGTSLLQGECRKVQNARAAKGRKPNGGERFFGRRSTR